MDKQSTDFSITCVCGKICTSRPGLTLHQRNCEEVEKAKKVGKPIVQGIKIIKQEIEFIPEVKEIVDMVNSLAPDANRAILEHNKSAGRRARIVLTEVKNRITPLRRKILVEMKKKY
jgi:hypothetical protein